MYANKVVSTSDLPDGSFVEGRVIITVVNILVVIFMLRDIE
jgi:hypothetical protein